MADNNVNFSVDDLARMVSQNVHLLAAILQHRAMSTPTQPPILQGPPLAISAISPTQTAGQQSLPTISQTIASNNHITLQLAPPAASVSHTAMPIGSIQSTPNAHQSDTVGISFPTQQNVLSSSGVLAHHSIPTMNPMLQPYNSARAARIHGHPALPSTQPSSTPQQIPSFPSPFANTINQQRLAHSAMSQPGGRHQNRCGRGPSIRPPTLNATQPLSGLSQAVVEGSEDLIHIIAKIYPPKVYTSAYFLSARY